MKFWFVRHTASLKCSPQLIGAQNRIVLWFAKETKEFEKLIYCFNFSNIFFYWFTE